MGIKVDTTNFNRKKKDVIYEWGKMLAEEMILRVPKEYGTMADSIDLEFYGDKVTVGTHGIPYAAYVEFGTGPHTIPNAFGTGMNVEHPGVKVGTPENPRTTWKALEKRGEVGLGQTMPFATSADFFTEFDRMAVLKEAFHR